MPNTEYTIPMYLLEKFPLAMSIIIGATQVFLAAFIFLVFIGRFPRKPTIYTNKITLIVFATGVADLITFSAATAAHRIYPHFNGMGIPLAHKLPKLFLAFFLLAIPVIIYKYFRKYILHYIFLNLGWFWVRALNTVLIHQIVSRAVLINIFTYLIYTVFSYVYLSRYFDFKLIDLKLKLPKKEKRGN